jgi:CRP/FNR family transcriptional regulator, cyclic AMP receptor protein
MENLERRMDLLRTIGPFAQIPTAPLRPLAEAAEVLRFSAGDVIVRQGDPGDAVYALTDGAPGVSGGNFIAHFSRDFRPLIERERVTN